MPARRRSSATGRCLRGYHVARAAGWTDGRLVDLIGGLDEAVAAVDGHGFRETPFEPAPELGRRVGLTGDLWVKDETGNVAGSHKARHLMGAMVELLVAEGLGGTVAGDRRLAIASCGNAALAAAVVARAAAWPLDVFVPDLGGCAGGRPAARPGRRDRGLSPSAPARPAIPRSVACARPSPPAPSRSPARGPRTGSRSRAARPSATRWSSASPGRTPGGRTSVLDAVVVQVGGGALASAVAAAFAEARAFGGDRPRAPPLRRPDRGLRTPRQGLGRRPGADRGGRARTGPRARAPAPIRVHAAVAGGAGERRPRDPRRRDLRLAGHRRDADPHRRRRRRRRRIGGRGRERHRSDGDGDRRRPHRDRRAGRPPGPDPERPRPPGRDRGRPVHRRPAPAGTAKTRSSRLPPPRCVQGSRAHDEKLPRPGHPVPQGLQPRRVRAGVPGRRRPQADRSGPPEHGPAEEQDAADRVLPAEHPDAPVDRGRDASPRRRTSSGSPTRR